jgi:hypothetical protein
MGGGGPNRNPNYDGGNMRPRGNAQQLMEKFLAMARDASAMGDRVAAENYYQHADHYYRVLNARFEQQQQQQHYNNGQRHQHGGQRYDNPNEQGGDNPGEGQGYQPDGNRQDFNRNTQGNYGGQQYDRQPQQDMQPAAETYPQQQQSYQPPQPAAQADQEIGLPPGILGMPQAPPLQQNVAAFEGSGEEQQQRSPRRRRGRGHGARGGAEPASQD